MVKAPIRLGAEKGLSVNVQGLDPTGPAPGVVLLEPLGDERIEREAFLQSNHPARLSDDAGRDQSIGAQSQGAVEHRFSRLKPGDPDQQIFLDARIQALHSKAGHPRRKAECSLAIPERQALRPKNQKRFGLAPKKWAQRRFALSLDKWKPPLLRRLARPCGQLRRGFAARRHRQPPPT